ncbi:hypothetical protein [Hoeflea sp. 108]|uniref:hypothetical protein n=1 Tax=Hoeflea sp. 108 TaxID=1116369 RepID=UPI0003700567|nr:hypothetical protein [Hoeflea sp. 108]
MDQQEFEALMRRADERIRDEQLKGKLSPSTPTTQAPDQVPVQQEAPPLQQAPQSFTDSPEARAGVEKFVAAQQRDPLRQSEGSLAPAGTPDLLEAGFTGALKGVFETKDFLFGEPMESEKSNFRTSIEARDKQLDDKSLVTGFSSGIGQFAIAMVGLGKVSSVAKALPWFGKGLGAVISAAPKTAEVAKAALAGSIAFDPHEERLSNLIQETPMANPVNAWLAADPNDSAAEGRIKAALESIGLDATILGTFMASTKAWKWLRMGDAEKAGEEITKLEAEKAAAIERQAAEEGAEAPTGATAVDESVAPAEAQSLPTGSPESTGGIPNGEQAATPSGVDSGQPSGLASGVDPAVAPAGGSPDPAQIVPSTAAAKAADDVVTGPAQPRIRLSDENTEEVLKGLEADADAVEKFGGWYDAIEGGHVFGRGEGVPYAKLNMPSDVDDFMARVVDVAEERLDRLKGGAVVGDEKLSKVAHQMARLYNSDPAQVIGMVQQAGKEAASMVAKMEAGYLVSNRMFQDTYALAVRIKMGDFAEFGSRVAAQAELKKRMSLAASVYGAARSMTSASGRSMRRMRMEFKVDPEAVVALNAMEAGKLTEVLVATEGNTRNMAKVVNPGWWARTQDWGSFLLINNLVSGPKTHLTNLVTNTMMVTLRPMERVLGSALGAARGQHQEQRIFNESLKQYVYLGSAFVEGFGLARKAFLQNDSVLAPHATELYRGNQAARAAMAGGKLKPWTSPGNILSNALRVAAAGVGLPTRSLGFVDEAVKQTVYRSKVMARAHVAAMEEGVGAGLAGDELAAFIKSYARGKLDVAFDEQGRGLDAEALREAQVATFQQELLPNTLGKWVQSGVEQHPWMRLMLPFVKTPTNIMRYGWKLTPGLNLLQQEYREMLKGAMGPELKAQATGQMMMGGLFMGSAAFLVSQGTITGGGPRDYKMAQELKATGWQPYSLVVEQAEGSKTYVPLDRMDPMVLPFGIMADLMDALYALEGEETPELGAAIGGLLVAVSRQFTDKTYLTGVGQVLEALMQPEGNRLKSWANNTASNFVPFSGALRQMNPDPHLRQARELTDKLMATIPGLSENLPARYNAWGDPLRRVGLWSSDEDQLVDREMQRLLVETGVAITAPQPVHDGVDLRDLTLSDGGNAYERYQQLAGHPPKGLPLKAMVAKRMASRTYQLAPDGPMDVKGTKLWLLHPVIDAYRKRAKQMLKRDPVVRDAFRADELKVRAQWKANKAAAGQQSPMKKLGSSFGVDLGKL